MDAENTEEKPDLEDLLWWLKHDYHKHRREAATNLLEYYPGDPRTFEAWLIAMKDDRYKNEEVIETAAEALRFFHNDRAFEALVELLDSEMAEGDLYMQDTAIESLVKYGERAIPFLLARLKDYHIIIMSNYLWSDEGPITIKGEHTEILSVGRGLATIGQPGFDALIDIIQHSQPEFKVGAIYCLQYFDSHFFEDNAIFEVLLNLLKDRSENSLVRASSAYLLSHYTDESLNEALLKVSTDSTENEVVKEAAIRTLDYLKNSKQR